MIEVTTDGVVVTTGGVPWSSGAGALFGIPGDFAAELIDDTSVALSWSPVGRATSYRLQREVLNGSWQHDAFLTTTETSLLDTISAGGQYRYRIQSIRTVD